MERDLKKWEEAVRQVEDLSKQLRRELEEEKARRAVLRRVAPQLTSGGVMGPQQRNDAPLLAALLTRGRRSSSPPWWSTPSSSGVGVVRANKQPQLVLSSPRRGSTMMEGARVESSPPVIELSPLTTVEEEAAATSRPPAASSKQTQTPLHRRVPECESSEHNKKIDLAITHLNNNAKKTRNQMKNMIKIIKILVSRQSSNSVERLGELNPEPAVGRSMPPLLSEEGSLNTETLFLPCITAPQVEDDAPLHKETTTSAERLQESILDMRDDDARSSTSHRLSESNVDVESLSMSDREGSLPNSINKELNKILETLM